MQFNLEKSIEILSQTPATVKSLLGDLSGEWTLEKEKTDEWSSFDVIGHYIHAEETDWIPRAEMILKHGQDRTFEPFDRFAQFRFSQGKNLAELLETFAGLRRKNIEILTSWNLSEEELNRKGAHPELGQVTLQELLSTWVVHDLTHIRQLVQILAKKYAENVGVWKAYLSILQ